MQSNFCKWALISIFFTFQDFCWISYQNPSSVGSQQRLLCRLAHHNWNHCSEYKVDIWCWTIVGITIIILAPGAIMSIKKCVLYNYCRKWLPKKEPAKCESYSRTEDFVQTCRFISKISVFRNVYFIYATGRCSQRNPGKKDLDRQTENKVTLIGIRGPLFPFKVRDPKNNINRLSYKAKR